MNETFSKLKGNLNNFFDEYEEGKISKEDIIEWVYLIIVNVICNQVDITNRQLKNADELILTYNAVLSYIQANDLTEDLALYITNSYGKEPRLVN